MLISPGQVVYTGLFDLAFNVCAVYQHHCELVSYVYISAIIIWIQFYTLKSKLCFCSLKL